MVKLLQWNVLADGLGDDGFLSTEFEPIHETADPYAKSYTAVEFMKLVTQAKQSDRSSGALDDMKALKKEQKKLKSMKPDSEEYSAAHEKVAGMKKKADESELVKLKEQFKDSPEFESILKTILSWDVRFDRIKNIILAADPDIITFQEMDHLKQFAEDQDFKAKYTCVVDDAVQYRCPTYSDDDPDTDDRCPENYLPHVLASRTAFAPKSYSHSYNFRKKRKDGSDDIDDDGAAIFWKKEKFKAKELGFLKFPSSGNKSEAVVTVKLQDCRTKDVINVLTTHLPSGDEPRKEIERLSTLKDDKAEWIARRIQMGEEGEWNENDYNGQTFDGIVSFVKYYAGETATTTVFALDANSRPTFPPVKVNEQSEPTSVWNEMKQTGLRSVWVDSKLIKENGEAENKDVPFVVSVNKMRGPASNQPEKIGEHQLELIDHVFTNGQKTILVGSVQLNGEKIKMAPLHYKGKKGDAELELNPTTKMPSDHLPVVVDIVLSKSTSFVRGQTSLREAMAVVTEKDLRMGAGLGCL